MLWKLAHVIARPLSIFFERLLQLGDVLEDWKKASVTISKQGKKDELGPTGLSASASENVMEQLSMETIFRQTKDEKVIMSGQHGFMK